MAILDEIGWQTLSSTGAHDFHVTEHSISFSVGSGRTERKLTIRFDDDLDRFDARLSHRRLGLWRPAAVAEGLCFDDLAHWVAVALERTGDRCDGTL